MIPIPPALVGQFGSSGFKAVICGLALIAAAIGGAYLMADHKDAIIARMEADQAKAEASIVKAGAERLRKAQALGDRLTNRLAEADTARAKTEKEHAREIKRLTTGRACLGARVVRVLNEPSEGNHASGLPASASQSVAEDGAFATDTDVADWADDARRQYDICRERLGALIDFETQEQ